MERRVFISQSNYIPWKGYFDNIAQSDVFVVYDEMQYTKNDWRNRNKIKTVDGLQWLTIPVISGTLKKKINETFVLNSQWRLKHWKSIVQSYAKAPYFDEIRAFLEPLYSSHLSDNLSEINLVFIEAVCSYLKIETKIVRSKSLHLADGKTERLVEICKDYNATVYCSSPIAKNYLVEPLFLKENIGVTYFDYSGYPEYHQLHGEFEHYVSIIDLLFNEGPNASNFMKIK